MNAALARRALACERWRWMPGMLARYADGQSWYRLTEGDGYGLPPKVVPPNPRSAWPDLDDPATLGCLLALARKAWGDPTIAPMWHSYEEQWLVYRRDGYDVARGRTEAEALIQALEYAP